MKFKFLVFIMAISPVAGWSQNIFPSSGNVGIGTTSPAGAIDIKSDATNAGRTNQLFIEGASDPNKRLYLGINTSSDFASLEYVREGAHWGSLALQADGGNVGIGTSTPRASLEVYSAAPSSTANLMLTSGQDRTPRIRFNGPWSISNPSESYAQIASVNDSGGPGGSAASLHFYTSSGDPAALTDKMMITGNGNVGIGTSTPGAKLDVYQASGISVINLTSSSSSGVVSAVVGYGSNSASATTYYGGYYTGIGSNTAGAESGYLSLYTRNAGAWSEKIRVDNVGNVGIGTANPTYPLTVNGTVRAKEVIVDTGWSDYVFDKNYKLPALSETEAAIKAEKHLPGIPSAKDVAEHGISVGEMQAKLLAKVEELTLYVIDLKKENEALKARVGELEGRQTKN